MVCLLIQFVSFFIVRNMLLDEGSIGLARLCVNKKSVARYGRMALFIYINYESKIGAVVPILRLR
jgi:hypothetical protein